MRETSPAVGLAHKTRLPSDQYGLLLLLLVAIYFNFIDRGALSMAAPLISSEFNLNPTRIGVLFSSFYWTYPFSLVLAGWFVDRFNVKTVLASGFLIWSIATFGSGLVQSVTGILLLRLLLGIGQSTAYPCFARIVARNFPEESRGLVNGLIDTGSKLGPALGTLGGGLLITKYGWRVMFLALGAAYIPWILAWIRAVPAQRTVREPSAGGPGIWKIIKRKEAWGSFVGHFCASYVYFFLVSWLPTYFLSERHFSMQAMSVLAAAPFAVSSAGSIFFGWWADRWIARGSSVTVVRKAFVVTSVLATTLIVPAAFVNSPAAAVLLLCVAMLFFGAYGANMWSMTQALAGPRAIGRWAGVQMAFASLAGIPAPAVTGWIVSTTGSFIPAFILSASVALTGAACYAFLIGPVEQLTWDDQSNRVLP